MLSSTFPFAAVAAVAAVEVVVAAAVVAVEDKLPNELEGERTLRFMPHTGFTPEPAAAADPDDPEANAEDLP